ncbi:MAG: hypothetical protein A3I19_00380 [Candidatus Zambryskibacteria bacterium RIFCSPLOWO2_02_FULL_38_13]|nr:MAG: hypothetical protein A3I19_00380 [Candidatus Zambryskibacteria bacterium RIFCSPLOWO2_02_FULL_38_13]
MSFSHKTRVGVLRGGPSPEYEVSLKTGSTILANLPEEYEPLDIFVSKDGIWHSSGLEKDPYTILKTVDVVVNAMHGFYGEDGTVQKFLENFGIPYTGSDSISSALGMNKVMSKNIFNHAGLKTPHHIMVDTSSRDAVSQINESLPFPIVIKPINSGSSLGVSFADNAGQIKNALKKSFKHSPKLMVEEFIDGTEVTCGVIESFRGQNFYTLLPVQIKQNKKEIFYDYDSKYNNLESKYKIPGNFNENEKTQIQEAASAIHKILGLRHYSRSDFILHPKRGLFVLEVNSLPELTHRSSFIKSLEATGSNIKEFLSNLLSKTLGK